MAILNVHYVFGTLVVLLAATAIFWTPARRLVLYALVVQIALGVVALATTHLAPPTVHWVLALVTGGIYALATGLERRGRSRVLVLGALVAALIVLVYVYQVGQHAVATAHLS